MKYFGRNQNRVLPSNHKWFLLISGVQKNVIIRQLTRLTKWTPQQLNYPSDILRSSYNAIDYIPYAVLHIPAYRYIIKL